MAFNAKTYRANKARKEAMAYIAKARDIKARALIGDAYDWEVARIPTLAKLAILTARCGR